MWRRAATSCSTHRRRSGMKPPSDSWESTRSCWRVMPDMPEQTLLAFDYGVKKIGVAIGNTLMRQARPLQIMYTVTREQRFLAIEKVLAEWKPDKVIVGL